VDYQQVIVILSASIVLQAVAVFTCLVEMRDAGRFRMAWLLITVALLLMLERRFGPLFHAYTTHQFVPGDALFALVISALLALGMLGIRRLFMTLKEQEERLKRLADTDPLTHLLNRRAFTEHLLDEVRRRERSGRPLSLLMIDVDHFKQVNDDFGHPTGDRVLVQLAEIFGSVFRDVDPVGRWGGEEFLVLMAETGKDEANAAAERLRAVIASHPFITEYPEERMTVSIGVTSLDGPPGRGSHATLEFLVKRADGALYAAKQEGRNRVVAWAAAG
jgi:diguanylate cyclase (GGDEF)-like protein